MKSFPLQVVLFWVMAFIIVTESKLRHHWYLWIQNDVSERQDKNLMIWPSVSFSATVCFVWLLYVSIFQISMHTTWILCVRINKSFLIVIQKCYFYWKMIKYFVMLINIQYKNISLIALSEKPVMKNFIFPQETCIMHTLILKMRKCIGT